MTLIRSLSRPSWFSTLLTMTVGLGAGACGDDDSGRAEGLSTSIDESLPLNDLDSSQLQTLCEEVNAFYTQPEVLLELRLPACRFAGAAGAGFAAAFGGVTTDAELQNLCRQTIDECLAGEPELTHLDCATATAPACSASVGEYVDCVNSIPELIRKLTADLDCSTLTIAGLTDPQALPAMPFESAPACAALVEQCETDAAEAPLQPIMEQIIQ